MKTVPVVAAILKKDNQILIAQRSYGAFQGKWEFPGGKIEEGETPEEALQREIMEELGITIRIDRFLMMREYDYPDFHLSMACFVCTPTSDTLHLSSHTGVRWIPLDDPEPIDWIEADELIYETIKEND